VISLDHGGKALRIEWKHSQKLFTDLQAIAQGIPKNSARSNGYGHTQDRMHQPGCTPSRSATGWSLKCSPLTKNAWTTRSQCVGTCR
jgi:hypothetical protein